MPRDASAVRVLRNGANDRAVKAQPSGALENGLIIKYPSSGMTAALKLSASACSSSGPVLFLGIAQQIWELGFGKWRQAMIGIGIWVSAK